MEVLYTFHSDAVGMSGDALHVGGGTLILAAVRLSDVLEAQDPVKAVFGSTWLGQDSIFPDPLDFGRRSKQREDFHLDLKFA